MTSWPKNSSADHLGFHMQLSSQAAYTAAADEYAQFTETALLAGADATALGEAMAHAGLALLVREMGASDAAAYALLVLRSLVNGEVAKSGH